jgi:RNA polymerase sigma-70 factor, ECF subfamily
MSLQLADELKRQSMGTPPSCNQAAIAETSLVAAARGGDAAAFEELVRRHERRLRRVAQRITRNREDAEDTVQGSLLQAFVHLRSFRGDSQFSTWLTRIVINEALMNVRRNQRKNQVSLSEPIGTEDPLLHWEMADLGLSPEEDFLRRELQEILTSMIEGLRPNHRIILQLRYLKELSINATAQILNLPVSTAKARLHRARLELCQVWKNNFRQTMTLGKPNRCTTILTSKMGQMSLDPHFRDSSHGTILIRALLASAALLAILAARDVPPNFPQALGVHSTISADSLHDQRPRFDNCGSDCSAPADSFLPVPPTAESSHVTPAPQLLSTLQTKGFHFNRPPPIS